MAYDGAPGDEVSLTFSYRNEAEDVLYFTRLHQWPELFPPYGSCEPGGRDARLSLL